ncbi:hypothetical protein ElyMa_003729000 [Elysia marginata]|uniref:Uncharacterized protein n=1 Tax=Elysia marginata TaxID=1093978 RepID=A0AAV4F4X9_9GAST|nr:hypothetical protein ElyMa_003729000 [Elysia marginata]
MLCPQTEQAYKLGGQKAHPYLRTRASLSSHLGLTSREEIRLYVGVRQRCSLNRGLSTVKEAIVEVVAVVVEVVVVVVVVVVE